MRDRTALAMPLTFSIANGIALGFMVFAGVGASGRPRPEGEVALAWVLAVLFLLRFLCLGG